jgi:hypothetical protein
MANKPVSIENRGMFFHIAAVKKGGGERKPAWHRVCLGKRVVINPEQEEVDEYPRVSGQSYSEEL